MREVMGDMGVELDEDVDVEEEAVGGREVRACGMASWGSWGSARGGVDLTTGVGTETGVAAAANPCQSSGCVRRRSAVTMR